VRARTVVPWLASLLAAGCLEKTPPHSQGYLPDSGGVFGAGACPDAGATPPDASADAAATDDADASVDAADDAGAWAGTWTFVSGGSGVACPDGISNAASMGKLTITASASGSGLTVAEDACTFHFTLVGDTATSDCGQSCSAWAIPTIPIWTLTLKPDGTLEEHVGGRIGLNGETCTISGTSKLKRL
jgi:hypothetical protein